MEQIRLLNAEITLILQNQPDQLVRWHDSALIQLIRQGCIAFIALKDVWHAAFSQKR